MAMNAAQGGTNGGKTRRRQRRILKPMSEINVTPFVDVMLVLLIVFMVSAPLLTVGIEVNLPKTAASALEQTPEEPLSLTITNEGTVGLQDTQVEKNRLITRLRPIMAERSTQMIHLRADAGVPYKEIVEVMGALSAAGFTEIGFVTEAGGPTLDDE